MTRLKVRCVMASNGVKTNSWALPSIQTSDNLQQLLEQRSTHLFQDCVHENVSFGDVYFN